jgi:hypothetical protein
MLELNLRAKKQRDKEQNKNSIGKEMVSPAVYGVTTQVM